MLTTNDSQARRSKLSGAKQALLEKLIRAGSVELSGSPVIKRRQVQERAPLSFAQHRLWFTQQLEPAGTLYNVSFAVRLIGDLDVDALEQTLNEIIRRHETLRTTFVTTDHEPVQIINPPAPLLLEVQDLSQIEESSRIAEVVRLAEQDQTQPFDLSRDQLMRVRLLRLRRSEHVVLLTMHHIVTDAWSTEILIKEVAALYTAYVQRQPLPLAELRIQYADFAIWQREWLQGEALESQLEYWRQRLAGVPPVLELPTDKPRPAVRTFMGATHPINFSQEVTRGIRALAQAEGATLFMTVLAAWQLLLHRYVGQDDIVVGTEVANRNRRETEGLIGFFVNQLVLRTDFSGNPTFRELLSRVKNVCLEAYAHEDLPFEKLVAELEPERNSSHAPFYQVVFSLQPETLFHLEMPGLKLEILELENTKAKFDLALDLEDSGSDLSGTIGYSTDLFTPRTIEQMVSHLITLVEAIVADPEQRISRLPLLTKADEQQLEEWNQVLRGSAPDQCIHQLVEAQINRTPEAIALICNEESLTYRELNARANQLANHLVQAGVKAETVVGIMMKRSLDMMVSLLAVLKAGGAYLPLDPSYPPERLSFMLADAAASVLLSQTSQVDRLPACDAKVILVDSTLSDASLARNPDVEVSLDNLAYVIYTSGSTGQPKATLIPHRAVVSHNSAVIDRYELSASDRVLQFASLSFDVAVEEIFPTWLSGGCVVLRPEGLLDSHAYCWDFLSRTKITVVNLPTAYWNELIAARQRSPAIAAQRNGDGELKLRLAAIGGEMGLLDQFALAQEVVGTQVRLLNVYGPTETTVTNTSQDFRAVNGGARSVPIGAPIANTEVYVLDAEMGRVPVGVSGELYLGGDGLARGYLNRPELTAEKFVPHPFSDVGGERLYRTGDVGRWLSDGSIEFLGRVDEQVKVRGYRIELGEIEAVLSQHPDLRDVVVVARTEEGREKRLVAYYVTQSSEETTGGGELRQYLKARLPEYMVPQAFVKLEELPLTSNGKVDRRRLPAPENNGVGDERSLVPARTPVEELLVGIWSAVLGVDGIGVEEDFFELGGHSLLATQVMSRVREAFGVEVALRELFERPTISELGECIERTLREGAELTTPSLVKVDRDRELPLSFAQQRLWFIDQLEPGNAFYNVPAAVRLNGDLNLNALEQTLNEVIRRHDVLRTSFKSVEGRPVQVIADTAQISLPVIDLSHFATEEREARIKQLIHEEGEQPFDLSDGPLLRVKLLRADESEYILLLTTHHIATDGWSLRVLVKEVAALYQAFINDQPSPLEELPVQYADFAAWQRSWLTGEVLDQQLAYWKQQMAGAPAMLELPTDRPRPAVQTFRGATHSFSVGAETAGALKELSQSEDVTFFMTLLAAWKVLLARYTGQDDLLVGTPIASRNRRETEDLIGFFVNTLVLRTDLAGNPAFRDLLRRVRETCLAAYAHQDLPFEKLVEELQPERSRSHTPLFQVLFALQNVVVDEFSLPGLSLNVMQTGHATSKFDLTLVLEEEAGELKGSLEYNSDLFDAVTIERLAEHFQNLLEAVAANPEQHILSLPLLSEPERAGLISQPCSWNAESHSLSELFEAQVERTPEHTALVHEGERFTYRELNAHANQLAHCLQGLGVGPESLVALYLDRSAEMVIAILAILKAGAAYLPLDLSWPAERVAFILKDGGASVLLTQSELLQQLPVSTDGIEVVCLDTEQEKIAAASEENPVSGTQPENLAYVIYTSGSTGQPKGALLTHANVTRLFSATQQLFNFDERDVWTLFHSYAFDFSVWEIFGPLLTGGRLVVVPYLVSRSPADFYELLLQEQVTVLNQTPSAFRQLMAVDEQQEQREQLALRLVIFGGEALELQSLAGWYERHEDRAPQLVNMYGITETTVHVTVRELTKADVENQAGSVIGRAIEDLQLYVLDSQLEPAPVGVAGELYVGGAGLARGYLKRAELTAEKFVPHPYSERGGERLYRTGDVGRWLSDGGIEYLGRKDEQVKIRGFRIELGEIETALSRHPAVRETVVVATTVNEDKRLVAYLVTEESLETAELRQYLKGMLPEYMVPQAFVKLDELPLTSNGKVDRRRLPAPEKNGVGDERAFVAARTPVEEVLVGIWSALLGVEGVGVEEDFFELGGHSLLATQLMSRVREALGVEVALRELFEWPTIRELGECIEQRLREGAGVPAPPIVRVDREQELPLSFAQQRLWFIDQLEPGRTVYNVPLSVRLSGALNVRALEQALNEIISRHEALRTCFTIVDEQPVQVISPAVSLRLEVEDLSSWPEAEREAEAVRRTNAEAHQPFDLGQAPLLRVKLLRLSESEHIVMMTMHHIITDGWSLGVLVKEVAVFYQAFSQGEPASLAPLPELPVQYADFAVWQRARLQGEELERQLSYWRQQLAGAPATLELPTDRPRPLLQTFNGAHQTFRLSAETAEAMHKLSRSKDVTLFMTLLAVWQVLLYRYTGQPDIVVGADVANRNRAETEGLIGFFVNMLVLRTNLKGDPEFVELLERVKEVCLGAYAHQDLPFEKLVEELQPERSLSHSPLFQVFFVLQNAPMGALELPGLTLSRVEGERDEAQFDLILDIQEIEGELCGMLRYNSDLFEAATMQRMVGHFQTLLAAVVADAAQRLSNLPLLTAAEEQQLIEWNETASNYPSDACVHQLFETQVEQTPEAIALVYNEQPLTYRELNRRANQLAHHLQSLGVGPEVCVGLCLERSPEMIVALLAILKAGGAYVPLDSSYPLERLAYMVADAQISVFVTTEELLDLLPVSWAQVVCLDTDAELIASASEQNPSSEAGAENLAYVMYTSGSTGQPKGVSVIHRSITRLVKQTNYIDIFENDVFLQSAPVSFDASTFEVWASLLHGARLVLLEQQRPTLAELGKAISENGVTVLWLTAGLFHLMVEEQGEQLRSVRRLLAGGDVLPVEQVRKHLAGMESECRLLNCYGPTENTTFTSCHVMERNSSWEESVPIGKPIANTEVYILDQQQQVVPVGVSGELYLGGDGLARGYLNRAELTAEKFVPHPFSEVGGERLYRTGDIGRWLSDGSIEFLGRKDEQVKIRGFRIELGEIETALSRHPAVREAVVVATTVNEDKRLVAYLVAEESLEPSELRQYLKGILPEYMVPQAFVKLDELPLTSNGKVDRRRLPVPENNGVGDERSLVAARTPVEEVLVGIWSAVLGVETIGVEEDFFELGGHSLLATQVMSRVREVFGVEVGLRELFERPTVKELGQSIERELRAGAGVAAPPIIRVDREQELPLSFAQQRLWFIDQLEPGSAFYNVPAAVRLTGDLQVEALAQTFTEVVRRHEVLRTRFANAGGRAEQVIEEPTPVELPVEDLSELGAEEQHAAVSQWAKAEAEQPFDLSRGPLLRVKLLRLGEREHVVLLTMHHIVIDGWSLAVFIREIAALYEAFINDQPSPLEELPVQYADFAAWQRSWLTGEVLDQQLAYWKQQMAAAPAMLELPTDRPRPAVQTFRGATHSFAVRAETAGALKGLSQSEDVTFFMTLLAAWKVLLARYTGQDDLLVGTPIASRNRRETEDLIGFFVNTLVLRTDLAGNPAFRELLRRVREVCLAAYAHQDLPFEKLVEELQPERSRSHTPLFQVSFSLQNVVVDEFSLPGLSLNVMQTGHATSKFDLTLVLGEEAGELKGSLEYNSDLFDAVTIERLAEHFQNLLEAVAANPEQHILSLPLLSEQERVGLISQPCSWDDAESHCLSELFEAQVERTPEHTALVHEGERFTYRELNAHANQLAHCLQGLGVGPESLVALYLDRSVEMVIAILAILKAGAAYLPLDLSWPAERVAFILKDGGASVLLTESELLEQLPVSTDGIEIVCLDTEQARIATASEQNPVSGTQPENLAYVIYTSGSTGQPKGALLTHANVTRLFSATQQLFNFDERDVWTLFHSYAFDFSVWEIFGPLLTGGRLVVVPYLVSRSPADFYELLLQEQVTVLNQTPSAFRQLMAVDEQQEQREQLALRLVIFGGEALELQSLGGWYERHGDRAPKLVNMYGITETTVHVTVRELTKADVEKQAGSVIGRAIEDLQLYVLDSQLEPLPVGVAGELYVGGAGLARGYLKRAELTAEKFVPHPYSERGGERLYRTGDVGRWLSDGGIEYLGRKDEQVKIRGFRIELGEIETALSPHPGVREALVMAREDANGDKRLVAYIVPNQKYLSTIADQSLHRLPNDLSVFHLNKNETEHLYREIFQDCSYLRHGLTLSDGDCVFDIGANIGLFTLFAEQQCRNLQTFAFEPSPVAYEKLRLNVERFGLQANLFDCGLSNKEDTATFTYYPQASVMSGFYPNAVEEKELFRTFMLNQQHAGGDDEKALLSEYADELTDARFESQSFTCRLRTISSIIAEYNIQCVDLLKVDVEKSEADVLEGINDDDWHKIKQVVVEVHDIDGRLNRVLSLLRKHGFEIAQEVLAEGTGVYNIFARREKRNGHKASHNGKATPRTLRVVDHYTLSSGDLRSYLKEKLPEYMVPSSFVMLEKLPLTPNGKVDRRALPAPQYTRTDLARDYVEPRTPTEEMLANIWPAILGVGQIGIDDNFFELGGHSLLATQLISRVREALGVEVALRELFEWPTIRELGECIEQRLREGAGVPAPPIMRVERDRELPLSFAQQRLWFIDQMEPGRTVYNVPLSVRLSGALNVRALEQSLNEIISRHEALRTCFAIVDEQPVQVISPAVSLRLEVEDLSSWPAAEREAEAIRRTNAEAHQPFDLGQAPLLRVKLLRLSESEHIVMMTMHHIITDGWSLGVLVKEVAVFYQAFLQGERAPLPELPVQYADFAVWQRVRLQGEELERQLSYWRQQLAGAPATLELPTDRPRPLLQTFNGAHQTFRLSTETTEALHQLSRSEDVTLFMTLLAVWQVLLYRYTGQPDIVVGADVANRNRAETEGLIGFFVNMLVLRTDLGGDPEFMELLERVKEVCLGAYAHQDLPFEKLVEELQPERSLSHSPLFQVLFVLQNAPLGTLELPGLTLSPVERERDEAQFDLILDMQEIEGELCGMLRYNSDLFEAATMQRMVGHFQTLLAAVITEPAQRLSSLPLLTAAEEQQLIEWNNTTTDYPREACVHQLFEAQMEQTPEAIALVYNEQPLTYRELNRRANQLAHHLQSLGVGPEVCVGLCLERSPEMIVALLAILKAGGAYVPLDSSYPLERLAYMVADAQISVLVTTEELLEVLPVSWAQVVCLDTDAELIASASEQNPSSEASAENLAYVMYTSGSTGQPKGVSVIHRSITRLVKETNYIEIAETDVFLQSAPISFDASTLEVWGSLLHGARLVLLAQRPTLAELGKAISENGVTVLWLTAGLFHLMVEEQGEQLRAVRRLLAGGDVLPVEQVRKHLAGMGAECRLINGYGPTENTTFTCCHVMEQNSSWQSSVPIGKPIANTEVYILDQQQQVVPVGVSGELYVGGDGLARGYLNRAELTAEKFVPHPFSEVGGERLYRTGDVARWLSDGSIEFLGRVDEQVKVRGYRIELGEIETALGQHPGVREAVVIATTVNEDKRLVAYLVAEESVEPSELRQYLKGMLPEYMVPQAFVRIEQLPLTSNGKVDRAKLPAVESWGGERDSTVTVSRTPVEEVLAGIWSEVLGVAAVGLTEDFFELGGHSLLATQVMSRVREVFGVEVGLRELFERPTVKELGQTIERELRAGAGVAAPPIVRVDREQELPLSFAQQRLWFIDQLEPGSAFYNVPAAVRLTGDLQVEALARTFTEVVRRHEVLRTRFANAGGRAEQVIEEPTPVELPVEDLSELAAVEQQAAVSQWAKAEAEQPFDLSRGPLLRVKLLRLGEREHVVLLTMHHIVIDGWSLAVFIREIVALYEAFINDQPSPLEELPVQYADFAAWQRSWLQGEVLEQQLKYWRRQLAGAPTLLELPTDKPRPAIYSYRGATHRFVLPDIVTTSLQNLSREDGCTLFMTLLAAFKTLLYRYTQQEDILVGAAIANRNRSETEDLIGFFVNTLVLRTDLSGDPSFRQLLQRVKDTTIGAYVHQDMPFEKLVEEIQPERSLSHTPLFQVAFGMHNTPVQTLTLPGLELSQMDFDFDGGRFDLTLWMEHDSELRGIWYYNTDLFEAATIKRMHGHFETIIESVLRQPDTPVSVVEMLSEAEKRQRSIQEKERLKSNASVLRTIRRKEINVPQATP